MVKKVREITIKESKGIFELVLGKISKESEYDFEGISSFKKILSKEKARILDTIKYKNPESIYNLAKMLKRPFKAVIDDLKLLERFGFIEFTKEKVKNRIRHKPTIIVDHMVIHIRI